MFKNEVMTKPYPINLFNVIAGDAPVPEDLLGSLSYVLCSLQERSREMVLLRYKDGKSYGEIAEIYGISRARAEAIVNTAVKTLQDPVTRKFVVYGVRGYAKEYHRREMQAMASRSNELESSPYDYQNIDIYDIELSTRSRNALLSADLHTIADIIRCGDRIRKLHNIGKVSLCDILGTLTDYGVNVHKCFPRTCYEYDIKGVS